MKRSLLWILPLAVSLLTPTFGEEKPDLTPLIETLMKGKDTTARMEAAKKLGQSKDPRAVEPLLKALKDENRAVRWAAIEALGELRDKAAVPALLEYLKKKEAYRWGKILTVNALASIKDPRAVEPLLALFKGEEDRILRRVILMALAKLGDERAIPVALELLKDEAPWSRRAAQIALVQLTQSRLQGEVPRGYEAWAKWYEGEQKKR